MPEKDTYRRFEIHSRYVILIGNCKTNYILRDIINIAIPSCISSGRKLRH